MTDFIALLNNTLSVYLRDLEMMVNTDCGTYSKAGVDTIAQRMRERMREFGAQVVDFPQDKYGDMLYGYWRGKGTARIVLIGHMDTVYSDGTVKQFSFRRLAGHALGPGVNDMKAGLLSGLYALNAVIQSGFDQFAEIGLFCNSDEEIGSPVSRQIYPQYARGADAALILEAARESGAIVSARKGVGHYDLSVHGKSAHAGVEPERGANAILALAQYTVALQALNGKLPGLTLNVGVVRGGTRSNVIAEQAEAQIDVRILRAEDGVLLDQMIREIVAREMVPGTVAEIRGGITNPSMEHTAATERLLGFARTAALELGFQLADVATGGGSDGNYTASLGTPTLDGLGPVGGKGHNAKEEYTVLESIVPRTALLAKLIIAIAKHTA